MIWSRSFGGMAKARASPLSLEPLAFLWQLLKRLEKGRFVWPSAKEEKAPLSSAQLSMLLEGIDWRAPEWTWRPLAARKLPVVLSMIPTRNPVG